MADEMSTPPIERTDQPARSRLHPDVIQRARKEIEERWLPDRIPEGWPPFDLEVSDGCTGVRQLAAQARALTDLAAVLAREAAEGVLP